MFTLFCFPFLSTNANYNKKIKLTKEEVKNIEIFFKKSSKNKYEDRWIKTWITREWAENIANWLRILQHSRISRWVVDKVFTKKDWERLFENIRHLV